MSDCETDLEAGTALFVEGDAGGNIYELISGVVRLSRMLSGGRREVLGFVFPGELFGSSGFGFAEPQAATCRAEAVTSIRVRAYPWDRLDELVAERPDFVGKMLAAVRRNLFHVQQQMLLLGRMSALERMVWFLLMMARLQNTEDDVPLYLPMSWDDIADYLGITAEAVSRVLFQLRKNQFVKLEDDSTVRIMNWHSMRLLAQSTRSQRGWWSRQVAEALGDLSEPERRSLVEHVVRCDRPLPRARPQAQDIPADRLRQIQMRAIATLGQRAAKPVER